MQIFVKKICVIMKKAVPLSAERRRGVMTYQTRVILRRGLPILFWLLALGNSIAIPLGIGASMPRSYWCGFAAGVCILLSCHALRKVDRHNPSSEEIFATSVLLSIGSYWLPTVLFLLIPAWGFLIYVNAFSHKSLLATLLGCGTVAIYAVILVYFGLISNPWSDFFSSDYSWGWIPAGAMWLAWLGSTIARQILRER